MKKPWVILIGVIVFIVVVSFAKDIIIKTSVEKGVEVVTGLPLKTSSFKVGIARTLVGIKNLTLYNPKGYKDKVMLDMPEIYVDYNLAAIFRGKVHLEEMRINLKEFAVIKNEKGEVNLDSLKVVQAQKKREKPEAKAKGKVPEIQIDLLKLKIGKVIYKDYSRGGTPTVQEFDVNIDEKYENITNPYSLVSLILVKSLAGTSIARLADIDLRGLQGSISDTLATASQVATEKAAEAEKALRESAEKSKVAARQASEEAEKAAKETAESIKKTTEDLKSKFKLPFGEEQ